MTLEDLTKLQSEILDWKALGFSSKYPMPIATAEALIKAAMACKRIPDVLKEAR